MPILKTLLSLSASAWVLVITALAVIAQNAPTNCEDAVRVALQAANAACEGTARNQVCYGNVQGSITPRNLSTELVWEKAGDRVNLTDIAGITLTPLDEQTGQWGVAVMQVQASLPDTQPGQNVTLVMFGDIMVNEDTTNAGIRPMQAFYLKTGVGTTQCAAAPTTGIMIQTPKGAGIINLTVNGARMAFGSSAFITTQNSETGERLRVTLLQGRGLVETPEGYFQLMAPGSQLYIEIDEEGTVYGQPSDLEAYDRSEFGAYDTFFEEWEIELPEYDDFDAYLDGWFEDLDDDWLNDFYDPEDEAELMDVDDSWDDNHDNNVSGGDNDDGGGDDDNGGGDDDDGGNDD